MAIAAQTDYELGQDNIQLLGLDVHNPVFVVSSLTIVAFVAGVLAFRDASAGVFDALYAWLTSTLDWVFMGTANVFVLFCLMLLVTPLGRVRLGGPEARPDYSAWSWFAMLFAAGIGIGLMFFGVAEPVDHFLNPPLGGGLVALQAAALATGFPFALVLVAMCYSTWKGLRAARGANP